MFLSTSLFLLQIHCLSSTHSFVSERVIFISESFISELQEATHMKKPAQFGGFASSSCLWFSTILLGIGSSDSTMKKIICGFICVSFGFLYPFSPFTAHKRLFSHKHFWPHIRQWWKQHNLLQHSHRILPLPATENYGTDLRFAIKC